MLLCIESRIYREGLQFLLAGRDEVSSISICEDRHALPGFSNGQAHCNLILVDVALGPSREKPAEAIAQVYRAAGGRPVVALGLDESDDEVLALIEAGAAAFVSKNASVDDLVEIVQAAANKELHLQPHLVRLMQQRLAQLVAGEGQSPNLKKLSQREHHILDLLTQRQSNKQIARTLGLEVSTIKNHVHSIIVKLGVANRREAASMALVATGMPLQ